MYLWFWESDKKKYRENINILMKSKQSPSAAIDNILMLDLEEIEETVKVGNKVV